MKKATIPLDSSPEHAAALGRLIGHWAIVEFSLSDIFQKLSGTPKRNKASLILESIVSVKTRLDIIERLIQHFVADCKLKTELEALMTETRDLNSERNAIVHAAWTGGSGGILKRIRTGVPYNPKIRSHKTKDFSAEDIQDVVDRIASLAQRLIDYDVYQIARLPIQATPLRRPRGQ